MNQFSLNHTSIGKVIALVHADPEAGIATFAAFVPFVRKRPQITSKSIIFCQWINNEQIKHIWYWKAWYFLIHLFELEILFIITLNVYNSICFSENWYNIPKDSHIFIVFIVVFNFICICTYGRNNIKCIIIVLLTHIKSSLLFLWKRHMRCQNMIKQSLQKSGCQWISFLRHLDIETNQHYCWYGIKRFS